MSTELFWLVLTIAMTGLLWVPYIVDRLMVRGPIGAMANPSPKDKPQSAWAQRLMAAHINAGKSGCFCSARFDRAGAGHRAATAFTCALYFWARLAHVVVYTLGIPVFRTLTFAAGFVAQVSLMLAIFKLI
jgi:uncharacterized MAPEG superfamily protein